MLEKNFSKNVLYLCYVGNFSDHPRIYGRKFVYYQNDYLKILLPKGISLKLEGVEMTSIT